MREISAAEYAELREFNSLESIGYERADFQALVGATMEVSVENLRYTPAEEQSPEDAFEDACNAAGI